MNKLMNVKPNTAKTPYSWNAFINVCPKYQGEDFDIIGRNRCIRRFNIGLE